MIGKQDPRIAELLELANELGIAVPFPPSVLQNAGAMLEILISVVGNDSALPTITAQEPTPARYEVVTTAQGSFVLDHIDHTAYAIVIPTYKGGEGHD